MICGGKKYSNIRFFLHLLKIGTEADFGVWGPWAVKLKRAIYYLFDKFTNIIYKIFRMHIYDDYIFGRPPSPHTA